jgi:hypothetical protein
VQPSTLAASSGSFGIAIRPARMKIANTDVEDHTSAIRIDVKASLPSISQGIA